MTPMTFARRAALALSVLAATPVLAQQPLSGRRDSAARPLETRVRQRMAALVKERLALTDDQMRQLAVVNASYETRRRDLIARERESRSAIREELAKGKGADQTRVQAALDSLFRLQRERIDIAEQEQRDLAKFMQPAQRAGYLALQEQLRRRVEEMRGRRAARANAAGARP